MAAVVEVLGKPAQQFRKLQGRFIRAGGLVLEEAGEIDRIVHDLLRVASVVREQVADDNYSFQRIASGEILLLRAIASCEM